MNSYMYISSSILKSKQETTIALWQHDCKWLHEFKDYSMV